MPKAVTAPPMIAKPRGPSRSQSCGELRGRAALFAAWPASRGSTAWRARRECEARPGDEAGRPRPRGLSRRELRGVNRSERLEGAAACATFAGSAGSATGAAAAWVTSARMLVHLGRRAREARSRSRRCGSERRLERPSRPPVGAGAGLSRGRSSTARSQSSASARRSRVSMRGGRPPFSRRAMALCDVAQSRASSTCESPRASRRSVTCAAIEAKSQPSSAWASRRRSRSNGSAGVRFARPFAVSSSDLILAIYHV